MAEEKVAGNDGNTYGDGGKKLNVGPAVSTSSVLQSDGSVKVDGKTVFDPKKDGVELQQDDPDIDYAGSVGVYAVDSNELNNLAVEKAKKDNGK